MHNVHEPHAHTAPGVYDLNPTFPIASGQIQTGFAAIAELIGEAARHGAKRIAIDGFGGTLWSPLRGGIEQALHSQGIAAQWHDAASYLLPESALLERIAPNLGGDDPLFGKLYEGDLSDFFDAEQLKNYTKDSGDGLTIIYGVGAALFGTPDVLLYVDVPKDEIQRRMSAKQITNLGAATPDNKQVMYKRFYFVEWPMLNRHKAHLLPTIDGFIDGQNPDQPTFISGNDLRAVLAEMAQSYFRVRPWFAAGPWGGQWMKEHFTGIAQDVPNYAWSFELIVPENGLILESGDQRLECSFDLLMFGHYQEVLGSAAERFGYNFPIRFDYLDTFEGGNLSIQCHPGDDYIREQFGEPFTQDESYYITTCTADAGVYLGFREGVESAAFRSEVERSQREGVTIDVEQFVNRVPAQPHDLFLIPSGTIHGSGVNNLVLEISATPYIYTFKIYDWMRRDLEGNLRPLNIERAWHNLRFERDQGYVQNYLIPKAHTIREGDGWREVFVGTHEALFYAVHRYEFEREISAETGNRCHILNVVEGEAVILETANGHRARFNFGETFVVPAAAGRYQLRNVGQKPCKVVCAFVK